MLVSENAPIFLLESLIMQNNNIRLKFLFLIFWVLVVFTHLIFGSGPFISGDSPGYKNPLINHDIQRIIDSVSGESVRSWVVVAIYEILGNSYLIILFNTILYILMVASWIKHINSRFNNTRIQIIALVVIPDVVCNPFYTSLNNHILI